MAITQADIDNLEVALAKGYQTVEIEGRRVTYRSIAELRSALAYAKAEVAQNAAPAPSTQSFMTFDRS